MHKYSLASLIRIMGLMSGWVDREKGSLLHYSGRYAGDIVKPENLTIFVVNEKGEELPIPHPSERYVRIPAIASGRSAQFFLEKHNFSKEKLDEYGITPEMIHRAYPLFNGENNPLSKEDFDFGSRVLRLSEDENLELPDIMDYCYEEILDWCKANNLEIIEDYVPEED